MTIDFNPLNHPILFTEPKRLAGNSAWIEHLPFGRLLVTLVRPGVVVELGTHWGHSYCGFCQAVAENALATKCYAVDTWVGDDHAGLYGDEVLADLRRHHDPLYGGFSELLRMTFEEASKRFSGGVVDLLHIDGRHGYQDAKGDLESWMPKMSDRGVILMHDTQVRSRDFGVFRLWEEVRRKFPSFEFLHGFGLGVLAIGREVPNSLAFLFEATDRETEALRRFFQFLGAGIRAENARCLLEHELHLVTNSRSWRYCGALRGMAARLRGSSPGAGWRGRRPAHQPGCHQIT